ncbi:hypothetical protein GQ44DRAFT_716523 [Phaeosphaeriaceae sp. PMI808]|nr:hypothetical protein GQ44DRAFT_716523 [Phaeosphaeriaceae sp. PMI808]
MRITFVISTLAALASSFPYPQDQENPNDETSSELPSAPVTISIPFATPTIPTLVTTSLNIPVTQSLEPPLPTTSRKRPHWEPIPIFTKECKCDIATVRYPCWATDALQKCYYEENFSYGCYMAAAGGCPTPTRTCKDFFQPTPRSGRHPCDFGHGPPLITDVPTITTLIPVVPTLNISFPVVPTLNISLPVAPTLNISLPVVPTANVPLPPALPTANVSLPISLPA